MITTSAFAGKISGTVTSKDTGNNLQGALVSIPALNRSVVTDSSGRYVFHDVPAGTAEVAADAVLNHLGAALQRADLADAGDIAAVPLDAELEVLVGVEARRVDAELGHGFSFRYVAI